MGTKDNRMASENTKLSSKYNTDVIKLFGNLNKSSQSDRVKSAVSLLEYLVQVQGKIKNEGTNCHELTYSLERLIRGLSSQRPIAQKSFFATFVALLSTFPHLTVHDILSLQDPQKLKGESFSKKEVAGVCFGKLLLAGALIRSRKLLTASKEEQAEVINLLLRCSKKKSYLPTSAYMCIFEFMEQIDEECFLSVVWPVINEELSKNVEHQNLDTLFLLLASHRLFPGPTIDEFLKENVGISNLLEEDTVKNFGDFLKNVPIVENVEHPVYEEFCKLISGSPKIIKAFWNSMEQELSRMTKFSLTDHIAAKVFKLLVQNMNDKNLVVHLLTPAFIHQLINTSSNKQAAAVYTKYKDAINTVPEAMKSEGVTSKTLVAVIRKLMFNPGNLMFQKTTGVYIVNELVLKLDAGGVKELAKLYRKVILGKVEKHSELEAASHWTNNERTTVVLLLTRLVQHKAMEKELDWKVEQMEFFVNYGPFHVRSPEICRVPTLPITVDIAKSMMISLFKCLDHNFHQLSDMHVVLSAVVNRINYLLDVEDGAELVFPQDKEVVGLFKDAVKVPKKLQKFGEDSPESTKFLTFSVLFMHMGLLIFLDREVAEDALQELHSCYEKVRKGQSKKKDLNETESEPEWIDVIVDLFVSLLSRDSLILKSSVAFGFRQLCPFLTSHTIEHIGKLLDPESGENPLKSPNEDDESEGEDEEIENCDQDIEDAEEKDESSSDESSIPECEQVTVAEQFRSSVKDALGLSAALTDTESIDLDEMGDEEMERVDRALSDAFSMLKASKQKKKQRKKLSKEDLALMQFRIRILDLVETCMHFYPRLDFCCKLIPPLISCLKFSIKDPLQRDLKNKVRSCLGKIHTVKKFSSLQKVKIADLVCVLNQLVGQGTVSTPLALEMSEDTANLCVFIVKCALQLRVKYDEVENSVKKKKKKTDVSPIVDRCRELFCSFFQKRDFALSILFFKRILALEWEAVELLAPVLLKYIFDSDSRPFRRIQAVELLAVVYKNKRMHKPETAECLADLEDQLSSHTVQFFNSLAENKENRVTWKLVLELLNLLRNVKSLHQGTSHMDWESIKSALVRYKHERTFNSDLRTAFNKLACQLEIEHVSKKSVSQTREDDDDGDDDKVNRDVSMNGSVSVKKQGKSEKRAGHNPAHSRKQIKKARMDIASQGLEHFSFSNLDKSLDDDSGSITADSDNNNLDPRKKNVKKSKKKQVQNSVKLNDSKRGSTIVKPAGGAVLNGMVRDDDAEPLFKLKVQKHKTNFVNIVKGSKKFKSVEN